MFRKFAEITIKAVLGEHHGSLTEPLLGSQRQSDPVEKFRNRRLRRCG